jgi:hypothetical protein
MFYFHFHKNKNKNKKTLRLIDLRIYSTLVPYERENNINFSL